LTSGRPFRLAVTDQARIQLLALGPHTRAGLRDSIGDLAADPYGGTSIPRTGTDEDDRVALIGIIAVTYMVSPDIEPPTVTITGFTPPKPRP
jgi:hypothetical protein